MADALSPEFIKQFNALTPAQQEAVRALGRQQNQPGQQFIPTVQNGQIVIPTTGTPRVGNPADPTFTTQPLAKTTPEVDAATRSAAGSAASLLRQYGLEELIPIVDGWIRSGMTWAEVENQLYDRASAAGKIVDRIYPELRLRQEKGLSPVSIAEVQDYRSKARQVMRAAGLPEGFYDQPSDFTDWIANDVGLPELNDRVNGYKTLAAQAPPETLMAMNRLYGVGAEGLAAFWMDPTKALPLLEKQAAASTTAGAAARSGFGDLTKAEAERLAPLLGGNAVDAFGQLAQAGELAQQLPGETAPAITRAQQIDFLAGDANAAAAIAKKAQTRASETKGSGGFATSNTGYSGFGKAS